MGNTKQNNIHTAECCYDIIKYNTIFQSVLDIEQTSTSIQFTRHELSENCYM